MCCHLHLASSEELSLNVDWNTWAEFVERGVNTKWAVRLLREGAPCDRKIADEIQDNQGLRNQLKVLMNWLENNRSYVLSWKSEISNPYS